MTANWIAALCALAGVVAWILLLRTRRGPGRRSRALLGTLVAAGLACRITFVLLTPEFYAPDEQAHFKYVKYLQTHAEFPVQRSKAGSPSRDWEYYQPPLYYLALTPIYAVGTALTESRAVHVRMLRLPSILLWLASLWLALGLLSHLGVYDPFVRAVVAGMFCCLPTYTFLSSVINNDNLLLMLCAAALWLTAQPPTRRRAAATGLVLGLGLLSKLTTVVVGFAVVAVYVIRVIRRRMTPADAAVTLALIGCISFALFAPWAWRNWELYGEITAESVGNLPAAWPFGEAVWRSQDYMKQSFWAVSGIYNNVRFLPGLGVHVTYLALLGLMLGLARDRKLWRRMQRSDAAFWLGAAIAMAVNIVLVLRFGWLYRQGQGRFLFPLLIPIGVYTAWGIKLLLGKEHLRHAAVHATGFFVTYCLAFTGYCVARFFGLP